MFLMGKQYIQTLYRKVGHPEKNKKAKNFVAEYINICDAESLLALLERVVTFSTTRNCGRYT